MLGSNGTEGWLHIVVGRPSLDFSFKICQAYIKIPVSDFGRKKKRPRSTTLASLHDNFSFWLGGRWDLWRERISYSLPQTPCLTAVLQTQPASATHNASLLSEGT